jgi:hypothetical protein
VGRSTRYPRKGKARSANAPMIEYAARVWITVLSQIYHTLRGVRLPQRGFPARAARAPRKPAQNPNRSFWKGALCSRSPGNPETKKSKYLDEDLSPCFYSGTAWRWTAARNACSSSSRSSSALPLFGAIGLASHRVFRRFSPFASPSPSPLTLAPLLRDASNCSLSTEPSVP